MLDPDRDRLLVARRGTSAGFGGLLARPADPAGYRPGPFHVLRRDQSRGGHSADFVRSAVAPRLRKASGHDRAFAVTGRPAADRGSEAVAQLLDQRAPPPDVRSRDADFR